MIQEFNDLPWHDAELKGIIIEREQKENVRTEVPFFSRSILKYK